MCFNSQANANLWCIKWCSTRIKHNPMIEHVWNISIESKLRYFAQLTSLWLFLLHYLYNQKRNETKEKNKKNEPTSDCDFYGMVLGIVRDTLTPSYCCLKTHLGVRLTEKEKERGRAREK